MHPVSWLTRVKAQPTWQDKIITLQSNELLRPGLFNISCSRGLQLCDLFKDPLSHQAVWKQNSEFIFHNSLLYSSCAVYWGNGIEQDKCSLCPIKSIRYAISRWYNNLYDRGVTGSCGSTKEEYLSQEEPSPVSHLWGWYWLGKIWEQCSRLWGIQNRRSCSLNWRKNQRKNIGRNNAVPGTHIEPGIVPIPSGQTGKTAQFLGHWVDNSEGYYLGSWK